MVTLLAALLDGGDANSHLVTLDDLAYYAFFAADAPRGDLIGSGLVTGGELDDAGLGDPTVNPRLLLASGLISPEQLALLGLAGETVDKEDLIAPAFTVATGVTITEEQLVNAGLLRGTIDVDGIVNAGLATTFDLNAEGLIPAPLIVRSDLDGLGTVDYDTLDPVLVNLDLLLASGLVGADDRVDLDALLDEPIAELDGDSLVELSDLVQMGLVGETDLDGHNTNLFQLQGHAVSLAGDYGVTLTGMTTDAEAALSASVSGQFDLLVDLDGEAGGPTEGQLTYGVEDFELTGSTSFDVIDLDVAARLGFIGVTLADVPGEQSHVHVDMSMTVVLDDDESDATTDDRTFLLADLLDGSVVIDDNLLTTVTGDADANLHGIMVNVGLCGVPMGKGAEVVLEVPDLTVSKSDSGYVTLELHNLPGIFSIHEVFRLDDIMTAVLRARDYVMDAFDQLPFFVTDPNSPIYDLLSDVTIPVINKSPRELLDVVDWLDNAVDSVQRALLDPENDVQRLTGFIMEELGLDPEAASDVFCVAVEGSVIRLSLKLEEDFDHDLPFDFDL
ncbi:MAG: hypothetical protein GY708_06330, partial [Actinomycetia bacterium]|nr:hypothetical protein [Actinomycetes bacterium]